MASAGPPGRSSGADAAYAGTAAMVRGDMVGRLRLVLGALAAAALLAFGAVGSSASDVGADVGEVVAVRSVTSARTATPQPTPRPHAAVVAAVAILFARLASAGRGRRPSRDDRRPIDDVGDDWRSLLLGAPPALA